MIQRTIKQNKVELNVNKVAINWTEYDLYKSWYDYGAGKEWDDHEEDTG